MAEAGASNLCLILKLVSVSVRVSRRDDDEKLDCQRTIFALQGWQGELRTDE